MEARMLANLRVLVATVFVTLATLGPVSSKVCADPDPGSQGNNGKHKVVTIPDSGYTFGKRTASWEYTLTPVRCGG